MNITDKQRKVLEEWLTEENIDKLDKLGFKTVSSFIDLIIKTTGFDWKFSYKYTIIPYKERKPTELERKNVETLINLDRSRYGFVCDEYVSVDKVIYFPGGKDGFILEQTWFKGMSNSPSSHTELLYQNGERVSSVYNDLVDLDMDRL